MVLYHFIYINSLQAINAKLEGRWGGGGGGRAHTHTHKCTSQTYICAYIHKHIHESIHLYTCILTHTCLYASIYTHTPSIIVYKGKGYVHAYPPHPLYPPPPHPISSTTVSTHTLAYTHTPHSLPITVYKGKGVRACTPTPLLPVKVQFTSDWSEPQHPDEPLSCSDHGRPVEKSTKHWMHRLYCEHVPG